MLFSLSSEVSWSIFFFQSPWRLFPHRQYSHCSMSVYFFEISPCPCFHQKSMFPSNEKVNVPSLFFDRNVLLIFPLAVRDGCHFATSSPTVTPPPLTPTRLLHIFGMFLDSTGYPGEKNDQSLVPVVGSFSCPARTLGKFESFHGVSIIPRRGWDVLKIKLKMTDIISRSIC